jgi:hypothetical protein
LTDIPEIFFNLKRTGKTRQSLLGVGRRRLRLPIAVRCAGSHIYFEGQLIAIDATGDRLYANAQME